MIWRNMFKDRPWEPYLRTEEEAQYYKEHPTEDIYNEMEFWVAHTDSKILDMPEEELFAYMDKWILENCDFTEYDQN